MANEKDGESLRAMMVRISSGTFLLLLGGAVSFFFHHTQLDAHPNMSTRAQNMEKTQLELKGDMVELESKFQGDVAKIKQDVRFNRDSLIAIKAHLQIPDPVGPANYP